MKSILTSNLPIEQAIDNVLQKTENDILLTLKNSSIESKETLNNSLSKLEGEFDKIISDGKKEADKIEKQIIKKNRPYL